MAVTESARVARKQRGAWYTPMSLVERIVEQAVTPELASGRRVRVLDPACGDGRFLAAAARRVTELGGHAVVTGVDVDDVALRSVDIGGAELIRADALEHPWAGRTFDLVVGNPPFLSQMATATTRGGSSRHGGGPYADAAAEFLALAIDLARADGGRVALVLPQSILASRDAGDVRADVAERAALTWSWWSPQRVFDAQVVVCALLFERCSAPRPADASSAWTHVVTEALGIPELPEHDHDGVVGDRGHVNANFRDEYYGLVPAVADDADGPPLITSGLIDAATCHWGHRPITFAKRRFEAPRVALGELSPRMRAWADRKLVPKVLVANQTRVIEAVVDAAGAWLPGVPVTTVVPRPGVDVWEIAAVLTSPLASAAAWHAAAGTGLSARTVRLGPALLAALPWPAGDLSAAVDALRGGDVAGCGAAVLAAYAADDARLLAWWTAELNGGPAPTAGVAGAPTRASRRPSTAARGRPVR